MDKKNKQMSYRDAQNGGKMSGKMPKVMGQASQVYSIDTNCQDYDMGRVKPMKQGTRGYPQQAMDYQY